MQVNGNTPIGAYRITRIEDGAGWNQSSYGPNGAVRLEPASGNALAAEQIVGRKGLLIHGGARGASGYWRGVNELRATHGCVRLSNENMKQLVDLLFNATLSPAKEQCTEIEVGLSITDHQMSFERP